ncbi:MAG: diacylglycerol kinase family protein [Chthoniobacterales bacterium]
MKRCLIANPIAGSATAPDDLREKFQRLEPVDIRVTHAPGEAEKFAREAVADGCDMLVVAGGDGTLNEVVNGIAPHAAEVLLALAPSGTGNDFARALNLPDALDDCLDLILSEKIRAVDLVRVQSDRLRYFVNVSAGGFSGLVNEKLTAEMKQTWGPLAYLRCAAAALPELRAYRTEITLDNATPIAANLYNVVVANGRYVAGGIPIAPDAEPDDGLLDVVLIPENSGSDLALLAAQVVIGTHLTSAAIIFRRAARVTVQSTPGMWFNVDGEIVGNEPAVFEIVPRAIQFVAPAKSDKS